MTVMAENANFGEVIKYMKSHAIAYRKGWHGKQLDREMYIYLYTSNRNNVYKLVPTVTGMKELQPFLCLVINDQVIYGWLASQTDMLADDWVIKQGVDE